MDVSINIVADCGSKSAVRCTSYTGYLFSSQSALRQHWPISTIWNVLCAGQTPLLTWQAQLYQMCIGGPLTAMHHLELSTKNQLLSPTGLIPLKTICLVRFMNTYRPHLWSYGLTTLYKCLLLLLLLLLLLVYCVICCHHRCHYYCSWCIPQRCMLTLWMECSGRGWPTKLHRSLAIHTSDPP